MPGAFLFFGPVGRFWLAFVKRSCIDIRVWQPGNRVPFVFSARGRMERATQDQLGFQQAFAWPGQLPSTGQPRCLQVWVGIVVLAVVRI
jgi:hypothetical protein